MLPLNLPDCDFKLKSKENKLLIFDVIRKKYVALNPEEWVRQHIIHFLHFQKKYPVSLMAVEKQLRLNNLNKRTDIIIFNRLAKVDIIVECKAPNVIIDQQVFDQIARYNMKLNAKYLMVSNGLDHFFCQIDLENEKYQFLPELPDYQK